MRLSFQVDAGPSGSVPFEYRFRIYVPSGSSLTSSDVGKGALRRDGEVSYLPEQSGRYDFALTF